MLQENENFIRKCPHKRKFQFGNFADEDEVHLMKSSEYPNTDNEDFYSGEISITRKDSKLEETLFKHSYRNKSNKRFVNKRYCVT